MTTLLNQINLKEQLTDELKNKWYYEKIEWGLEINEHSVVFDKDFKFELIEIDWEDELLGTEITVNLNGETILDGECIGVYGEGKYNENPKNILEDILCYIANYI